jgi:UDP:flavonoid glycosyltransferase YjiC (YdhE family)
MMRVARLGLGGAIMSRAGSSRDWIELLQECLESRHVGTQIATAARLIGEQDGVRNGIDLVERVARATQPPRPDQSERRERR